MRKTMMVITPFLLATSACFSLGRDTPPLMQYVLGGAPAAAVDEPAPDPAGLTLGLRRLDLIPYLASPSIVVRRGAHGMLVSEYHRWGEDPVAGINRAFAAHLAGTAQVHAVDVAPWPVRSKHDFLVQLHVSRFEGVVPEDTLAAEGDAHLRASWELLRPFDGVVLARGGTDYRASGWRVGDYRGLVTLLDDGLGRMAGEMVACMERVGPPPSPDVGPAAGQQALACAPGALTSATPR